MRQLLLAVSPLALLLVFSAPALARDASFGDRHERADKSQADKQAADKTSQDSSRDKSSERGGRSDAQKSEARDNSGGRPERDHKEARNTSDVTGATPDRSQDRGRGGRDRDHDRRGDHDHDRDGDRHGHHDWGDRHRSSRSIDRTDAADRAWVRGGASVASSEDTILRQLIAEDRAEIAQAYWQYQLTRDRQMRNYLRQLIASRQARVKRLQARIDGF
jgi:hypothetical protein